MNHHRILVIVYTGFLLASCSTSQKSIPERGALEGTIYSIGSEPFTKIGLQTSDGAMYILQCPREIESELRTQQGKILIIYYTMKNRGPEGITLKVTGYK